jgi:hypothetical protein
MLFFLSIGEGIGSLVVASIITEIFCDQEY